MSDQPPTLSLALADALEPPTVNGVLSYVQTTPRSEVPLKSGSRRLSSSTYFGAQVGQQFEYLGEIPLGEEGKALWIEKIKQCRVMFVWSDEFVDLEGKEAKRKSLCDINDYLLSYPEALNSEAYKTLVPMIELNLFRYLPPKMNPFGDPWLHDLEDEPMLDLAWPHLNLVYEILLRLLEAPTFNRKKARPYFPNTFATRIVALFDSEDPRERDFLRMSLHRLYGKLFHLRPVLRAEFGWTFLSFAEFPRFSGIPELLEVLGSIVNGFAVPLKKTHSQFMRRVLLPLVKLPTLGIYIGQLTYCLLHFTQKDPALVDDICRYIYTHWPQSNTRRQVLLLGSLEEFATSMDMTNLLSTGLGLLRHLNSKCLNSIHFQVADRALALLDCPKIQELCRRKSAQVIPILHANLQGISRGSHWHPGLQTAAFKKLKWFTRLNASAMAQCGLDAAGVAPHRPPVAAPSDTWAILASLERSLERDDKEEDAPRSSDDKQKRTRQKKLLRQSGLPLDEETYLALLKHVMKEDENN